MLYTFVKVLVRLGLLIFFRKVFFEDKASLQLKGPLLLACNHPNSFLDALILGTYFNQPIHFLARGDAFKNPIAKKLLTALKVIPIYRLREGKEYLALNDTTFERCTEILMKGGIVLIFSEGLCINQWQLRPLKKGTARIGLNAWKQAAISNIFQILPVSLNYSSFTRLRKNVIIKFGVPIIQGQITKEKTEGEQITELNKLIYARLEKGLIVEAGDHDNIEFLLSNFAVMQRPNRDTISQLKDLQRELKTRLGGFTQQLTGTKKIALSRLTVGLSFLLVPVLFVPAMTAFLIHFPLYYPIKRYLKRKTAGTVFYHSALFGLLIIVYPIYTLIISVTVAIIFVNPLLLFCIVLLPLLAVISLIWSDCLETAINYVRLPKTVIQYLDQRGANKI